MASLDRLADLEDRGIPFREDEVLRALLAKARKAAGRYPPHVAEDAAARTAAHLYSLWLGKRKRVADVNALVTIAVQNQANGILRSERRHDAERLDGPSGCEGQTLADLVPSREIQPEDLPELWVQDSEYALELAALDRFLASPKTREKVRLIEKLAREGMDRDAIAARVTDAGYPATGTAVSKAISRLNERFPLLRELWANRAPDGSAATKNELAKHRKELVRRLKAEVDAADPVIGVIYKARAERRPGRDWNDIAGIAQAKLAELWTASAARDIWRQFILALPLELRRVAP